MKTASIAAASFALLAALGLLCLAWEWRIAPLRPGGSWMVVKALPLVVALPGIYRGKPYTYKWTSMLVLAYFAEGVVRALSDQVPASRALALVEAALATLFFACAVAYVRRTRPVG